MNLGQRTYDRIDEVFAELTQQDEKQLFESLVNYLAVITKSEAAWVCDFNSVDDTLVTRAFFHEARFSDLITYPQFGSVCGEVIGNRSYFATNADIVKEYPATVSYLGQIKPQSYVGFPLLNIDGNVIGLLAVCDSKPMDDLERPREILRAFASRTEVILQKIIRKKELDHKEQQLKGLIDGIQDMLINFDRDGDIIMMNSAAKNYLWREEVQGQRESVYGFLNKKDRNDIDRLIYKLGKKKNDEESFIYLPNGFQVLSNANEGFDVEGTLNTYELNGNWYFTLVIRSLDQKMRAEEELRSLLDRTEYLQTELEDVKVTSQLLGESAGIKMLWQDIYMVAHTDATVLIHGETGTGKELVARQIHQTSSRKSAPLVNINCGAIPANLIESELFGHVKGAFTGAIADRKGKFELADGGTIFLDEIGELPIEMQVKILRVIQEMEFEPVGSQETKKVDVRIIAATHRNLSERINSGEFREDLFYRLNVFPIEVPSLRDREDDVVVLADSFIKKFEKRMGKRVHELSIVQKKFLQSYHWPGNVRELQNIIERAVIISRDGHLDVANLLGMTSTAIVSENEPGMNEDQVLTRDEMLAFEKNNIIKALKACNGKVSGKGGAAEMLKLVPTTLSSRIRTLGIRKSIYEKS